MKKYGDLPKPLGRFTVDCKEMMFYQYLPIKMPNETLLMYESRLDCFDLVIQKICEDFVREYGFNVYYSSYIYVSAKFLYQANGCAYNRMGWHSDGFMTDDVNYIWSDKSPTIFSNTEFKLTMDDALSIKEMGEQAKPEDEITYGENQLLRLDQYNIHKVAPPVEGMRTFLKVSFSKDKYDLVGNSHNYLFNYKWDMKPRSVERNIPQSILIK